MQCQYTRIDFYSLFFKKRLVATILYDLKVSINFLAGIHKMYFCVFRQESQWTLLNRTVFMTHCEINISEVYTIVIFMY